MLLTRPHLLNIPPLPNSAILETKPLAQRPLGDSRFSIKGVAQVVEHLALSSIPSTAKRKKERKKNQHIATLTACKKKMNTKVRASCLCQAGLDHNPPIYASHVAGTAGVYLCAQVLVEVGVWGGLH
jgi:hypothetical protein